MITAETIAPEPSPGVAEFHRELAGELFNHVLSLLDRTDRNCAENDRMIHMAHASCFHWQLGGTAMNAALGEWLCARVHTVFGQTESALYHAWRYLEYADNYELGPYHLAQAHATLSGAFSRSNPEEAAHHLEQAQGIKPHLTDAEEREMLDEQISRVEAARDGHAAVPRPCC